MDLSSLYNTLSGPPDRLQQAENEMMERFKAAALSITHLYKSSVHTSKQAYRAGYSACLNDVLQTLQASLSTTSPMIDRLRSRDDFALDLEGNSGSTTTGHMTNVDHTAGGGSSAGGMTMHGNEASGEEEGESSGKVLARLMDWLEARQEAIKLETEEEKEKEEAESSAAGGSTTHPAGGKTRRPPGPARLDSMQMERPARPVSAPVISGRGNNQLHQATPTPLRTNLSLTGPKSNSMGDDMKTEDSEVEPEQDMSASITSLTSTSSSRRKPSGGIKQRDALVQAVANARARDRSSTHGAEEGHEERSSSLAPVAVTRPSSPVPINATTPNLMAIRDPQPNPSSPLTPTPQAYASHHRPYKGFGHYRPGVDHRSKLMKRDRDRDRESHSFNPQFGGTDLPLFPGTDSVGGEADSDVVGSGPYGFASQGMGGHAGGKRAHENAFGGSVPVAAVSLSNGHGHGHPGSVLGSAPVTALGTGTGFGSGGQGRGRRRGGHSGFAGFAMRGAGQVPGSEGEDDAVDGRERKRIARR